MGNPVPGVNELSYSTVLPNFLQFILQTWLFTLEIGWSPCFVQKSSGIDFWSLMTCVRLWWPDETWWRSTASRSMSSWNASTLVEANAAFVISGDLLRHIFVCVQFKYLCHKNQRRTLYYNLFFYFYNFFVLISNSLVSTN